MASTHDGIRTHTNNMGGMRVEIVDTSGVEPICFLAKEACCRYTIGPFKTGGCNGIRTHIGDFTRPLTADSLPIRFHAPIEIGGAYGN